MLTLTMATVRIEIFYYRTAHLTGILTRQTVSGIVWITQAARQCFTYFSVQSANVLCVIQCHGALLELPYYLLAFLRSCSRTRTCTCGSGRGSATGWCRRRRCAAPLLTMTLAFTINHALESGLRAIMIQPAARMGGETVAVQGCGHGWTQFTCP